MFCQLETLRHCLPPSVRRTLDELPESLDETYERIIKEIKKPNRDHALRILQCLVVAIRPLRVEELAEVLAVDFDDAEGMPKLNTNWRWEDQEQALLSSCSSLIAIVESDQTQIVQFSHFSVKEFLTSSRLTSSTRDVSHYRIALEPAHIILAQACMGVLLCLDDCVEEIDSNVRNSSPLASYAAEHWVAHIQLGKASACLRKAMETLFDPEKPYFEAWLQLHDMDSDPPGSTFYVFTPNGKSHATPLYYAALCGFQDLVEHLMANNPDHLTTTGGWYLSPLIAALNGGHSQTAKILRDNGAHPDVTGRAQRTPLHSAAGRGDFKMVQVLLECKADVNARDIIGDTPLHFSLQGWSAPLNVVPSLPEVVRLLLEHGADINAPNDSRFTPLHIAVQYREVEAVRLLLEYGADVGAEANRRFTPLHFAAQDGKVEAVRLLLEYGANVGAETSEGKTAFQLAGEGEGTEIKKLLSEYGAR